MFPGKLDQCSVPSNQAYPDRIPIRGEIMQAQIRCHINNLSPYKSTGTDEIPNIILRKCIDTILPFLIQIYDTVFALQIYAQQWKEIITCVL